jgi:hypothetical protein
LGYSSNLTVSNSRIRYELIEDVGAFSIIELGNTTHSQSGDRFHEQNTRFLSPAIFGVQGARSRQPMTMLRRKVDVLSALPAGGCVVKVFCS